MSPVMLNIWTDSLRCHSESPGFGIGEGDEPFVLVGVIDLDNKNAAGVPVTDMVLYGPLDDVDDQENHSFPFRPFWVAPFRPAGVILITAILEHDNYSPNLTRTAAAAAVQGVAAATVGAPRGRIISEALSALAGAVEPVTGPGANRLIGPPTELQFSLSQVAEATNGGTARQILRFSQYGDYSVHYLMRR